MKFDEITVLLGEFGKYQKRIYFLVCIPVIFTGLQMLSSVFTLAIPDHRCKIPSLKNDTYKRQGDWHTVLINQSIPWVKKDDEWSLSSCERYIIGNETVFDWLSHPVNVSQKSCGRWVYDKSVFQSTFITKENIVCGHDFARANANMILMGGVLVGAICIGVFADICGRKSAMLLSILLHIGGGFGSAFAPNYGSFVAFRFIIGMSNMGIYMSTFVIGMELVGPSKRVIAGIGLEFFWCTGLYLLNLLAYFVRTWNLLQLLIVCPAPLLIVYFWILPESPRWLLSRGKTERAEHIIQQCAKVNKVTLPEKIVENDTTDDDKKQSVMKMFTTPRLLVRTLIIYLNWCVISMVYYGLGLNVGNLDGDIYVNFAINATMEVAAYVLCLLLLDRIGRKPLHAGTMILGGVACLSTIFTVLYGNESIKWVTVVLANVGKFGISAAFAVIYVWSAELFPTVVRNSGMGSSSMMARVGGMVCPYIADLGKLVEGSFGSALALIIFGGLSVLAGVLSLFLPETRGKCLPESIEDAKQYASDESKRSSKSKYFINHSFDVISNGYVGPECSGNFKYKTEPF